MSHLYVPNAGNLLDYASATFDTSIWFRGGSGNTRAVNTSDPYVGVGCLEATAPGSAGDTLLLDRIGLWAGAGGQWAPPGYPINGVGQYTDNTAGKATYLWDETTAGWRLATYDSGCRDVTSLLLAAHLTLNPNAKATLQRKDGLVTFGYENGASATATGLKTLTDQTCIVNGFKFTDYSATNTVQTVLLDASSGSPSAVALYMQSTTQVGGGTHVAGNRIRGSISWITRDPAPTTLPGTQVTAPV